jgi:ferredoxin-NADP reductase
MAAERRAVISRIVAHHPRLRSLFLTLNAPGWTFRPGQFVSLQLPVGPTPPLTRAYSIASSPEDPGPIELCLDHVPGGPGSSYLFGLAEGTELAWSGPWGTFALDAAPACETVFVAEGTGIAPLRPMLRRAAATTRHRLHLLYAPTHPLYRDELGNLPHLTVTDTTPARIEDVLHTTWIDRDHDRDRHFYLCGVGDRVHRMRDMLRAAGYARRAVQYERW